MAHLIPQTRSSLVRLSAPTMERPCGARQGLRPQGKASPASQWAFLILPQESQLQALVPPSNGSFLRAGPFYSQFTLLSPLRGIPRT